MLLCSHWLCEHQLPKFPEFPYQSHFSLCFITSMGKDRDDGGRKEDAGQCVNSAVFGSDLGFFHCHIIYQNPSLEEAETPSTLMARAGVIPRQRCPVKASLGPRGFSSEGRLLVVSHCQLMISSVNWIPSWARLSLRTLMWDRGPSTYTHTELVYFTS